MLHNAMGGGGVGVYGSAQISVIEGAALLSLQGGGWISVKFAEKKRYVTL